MLGSNVDIMHPEWIDVIFKDRNQAYGAYELRRENPRNTSRALIIAISAFVFILALPTIINVIEGFIPKADPVVKITTVDLLPPPSIEKEKVQPPAVQQERQVRSRQDIVRFPPPVVRPDVQAHEDPPTDKALEKATTGQENAKGDPNAAINNIDDKIGSKDIAGVTEAHDDNVIFNAVEINPAFPGGEAAFGRFLRDHIRYPSIAKENNVTGRVFIQFVVERDGNLTDMKVLRDPGSGLGDEALRVLKSSPHWTPGIQNGKPVRVQFTVPVNFSLSE